MDLVVDIGIGGSNDSDMADLTPRGRIGFARGVSLAIKVHCRSLRLERTVDESTSLFRRIGYAPQIQSSGREHFKLCAT